MFLVNVSKLKGMMTEKGVGAVEMASALGIDLSTWYRKLEAEGLTFSVGQVHSIVDRLNMDNQTAIDVFLSRKSQK